MAHSQNLASLNSKSSLIFIAIQMCHSQPFTIPIVLAGCTVVLNLRQRPTRNSTTWISVHAAIRLVTEVLGTVILGLTQKLTGNSLGRTTPQSSDVLLLQNQTENLLCDPHQAEISARLSYFLYVSAANDEVIALLYKGYLH